MTSTEQQAVVSYLRNNGVIYQEVFDELFDHLASGIETAQPQGVPFTVALAQGIEELGGNEAIKKIQTSRKASFEQQYKRWHRRQLLLVLKNPVVVGVAALIGYVLWLAISTTPSPNRIQLLLGGFTTVYLAAWSLSLITAVQQYVSFKKGIVSTPYHLGIWYANRLGLAIFCGFLPVMTQTNWSLSLLNLSMIWVVCMTILAYVYIAIRLVNSSYQLVNQP